MINGIDVSAAGQGAGFPWESYRGKIDFAGVKISEGLGYADPYAKANAAGAHALGIPVIGYHFLHAGLPGQDQAEWFLRHANGLLKPGHDLIAIDAEDGGLDGDPVFFMQRAGLEFCGQLQRHFPGYWPVLYTELSMAPSLAQLGHCPLWPANPDGVHTGQIGPWAGPSFEQVGQKGVDTDVFYGDAGQLAKLAFR